MSKVYHFLSLAAMMFASTLAGNAQNRYTMAGGFLGGAEWTADAIEDDTECVLTNGATTNIDVLNGVGKSKFITDECLYLFEPTGETDAEGAKIYRLKRKSTNEYVANSSTFEYTTSAARAWTFKVKDATAYPSADDLVEGTDWTTATTNSTCSNTVIFSDASMTSESVAADVKWLLVGGEGRVPTYGGSGSHGSNVWLVYGVEALEGADYITDAMQEIIGDQTPDGMYNVGDQPGQISQELMDELQGAYDDAYALCDGNPTQEEAVAAVDRMKAAITAAKNGAVKVHEGYYYFRGNRSTNNATYDDGNGNVLWTYQSEWLEPEVATAADAKYIWHLTENPAIPGTYFIQNYYTKNYIGVATEKNQPFPTTTEPEESYLIYPRTKNDFTMESTTLIENPVEGWNGVLCTALHQMGDGNKIVPWSADAEASGWRFFSVDQSQIDAIDGDIEQFKLQEALKTILADANATYKTGFAYKSAATKDELYADAGLADTLNTWTNAQELQENAPIKYLFDGDVTKFFHSRWSDVGGKVTDQYHYLAVDLGADAAYANLQVKMTKRFRENRAVVNNYPVQVEILATNDTTGTWDDLGAANVKWNTPHKFHLAASDGTDSVLVVNDAVGFLDIVLGKPYRYVRMDVMKTGTGSGLGTFFNLGEMRVYAAEYDKENSLIEAVPADIKQALEDAITQANDDLDNEYVEQATIDGLKKALEDFKANYPDPSVLTSIINEAKAQAEACVEGTNPGYFQAGAKAALEAVVAAQEAKIKTVMSLDEINSVKTAIETAMAEFNGKLIKPADGIYYIKSATTATQAGAAVEGYLYAKGNASVRWMQDGASDKNTRLAMMWKLTNKANGFTLQNMLNGEFMDKPLKNGSGVYMSTEGDTCVIALRSAKVAGVFNLVMNDNVFANAQPTGSAELGDGALVTWGEANGTDNSAFAFEAADDFVGGSLPWAIASGWQIITLPVDVEITSVDEAYSVLGYSGEAPELKLELQKIEGVVKAGTPFFFYNDPEAGVNEVVFNTNIESLDGIEWAVEPAIVNGLQGTLASTKVREDYGRLLNGQIVHTVKDEVIGYNAGYLTEALAATTEAGDIQLPIEGNVIDGIATVIAGQNNGAVYTLSGVKVRANAKNVKNLPAGLYIVNGKKVLVK